MAKGLAVKYYNPNSDIAVVRCGREDAPRVRAAMTFVNEIQGDVVAMEVFHVCGSIRTCKEMLTSHQTKFYNGMRSLYTRPRGQDPSTRELKKLAEIDQGEVEDRSTINSLEL